MNVITNFVVTTFVCVAACGPTAPANHDATSGGGDSATCSGLGCDVVDCERQGLPPTTLSGTVYAPNGELPLYGATVYVPLSPPGPLPEGAQCTQCQDTLPGGAVANATSNTTGQFTLANVPSGADIPLVITIGKWRRQVVIPSVHACRDNPLPPAMTALPRKQSEGDIPKIGIVTGGCDALECLLRKIGVDDSEFTADTGIGRVHLYTSNGADKVGNSDLAPAATLWRSLPRMTSYDLTLFSCECGPRAAEKLQAYMDNVKAYADNGGRVFLSHYQSIWIEGEKNNPTHAPAVWPDVATCDIDRTQNGPATIDTVHNPKGADFKAWMTTVQATTAGGTFAITDQRQSCRAVDPMRGERWVYATINGIEYPEMFQFLTPNEPTATTRCGKVVFSDMHVAADSSSNGTFPQGCSSGPMSPQEKALAFMLFDIGTCVSPIL